MDLSVSPDGRRLAYLTLSKPAVGIHFLDLDHASAQPLSISPPSRQVSLAGWLDQSLVVLRPTRSHDDFSSDVEVLLVDPAGRLTSAGQLTRVFSDTARIDAATRSLLVTRGEDGTHDAVAWAFATRSLRSITQNTLSGVTFSGFVPMANGQVLGVREERGQDIWLISAQSRTGSPAGR